MKKIMLGVSEFSKIRTMNGYYVDKSNLIEAVLEDGSEVVLFTRPRRFGKTLNMTMLRDFFDITKDTKSLFCGLNIEQSDYFEELNGYPTLFFSFRDCKGLKEALIQGIKLNVMAEYQRYLFLQENLSNYDKKRYFDIYKELETDISVDIKYTNRAIVFLCKLLQEYYQKPVVLMIDEYDTPMVEAYMGGYYEEIRDFFTTLYGSALKDNPHLKKGILTGIQRVAKENIFSGLNNLSVLSVRETDYSQYFGMTPQETEDLLNYYELELTQEVTEMYNGYNFGEQQIYNPWSITNYAKNKKLCSYWVNTSSNILIRKLIREANVNFKKDFETLILHQDVLIAMDTLTCFWEMQQAETLWGLLLNSGYITTKIETKGGIHVVRIPNREVSSEFQKIVSEYTKIEETSLVKMFFYLVESFDLEKFKQIYQEIVLRNTSFYDAKENAYHMLFLGMSIYLDHDYEIKSNIEVGEGRSDLILKTLNPQKHPNLVIEFKQGEDVVKLARVAMNQIKKKQYDINLQGRTILMGVAHNKKHCEIVTEEYNGRFQ